MNTVTASFNTVMRQMTRNVSAKNDQNVSAKNDRNVSAKNRAPEQWFNKRFEPRDKT